MQHCDAAPVLVWLVGAMLAGAGLPVGHTPGPMPTHDDEIRGYDLLRPAGYR